MTDEHKANVMCLMCKQQQTDPSVCCHGSTGAVVCRGCIEMALETMKRPFSFSDVSAEVHQMTQNILMDVPGSVLKGLKERFLNAPRQSQVSCAMCDAEQRDDGLLIMGAQGGVCPPCVRAHARFNLGPKD